MGHDIKRHDFGKFGVVWTIGRRTIAKIRPVTGGAGGWIARVYDGTQPFASKSRITPGERSNIGAFRTKAEAQAAITRHLSNSVFSKKRED